MKSKKLYHNLISLTPFFIAAFTFTVNAQPNCNTYKKKTNCYNACLEYELAIKQYSGSKSFQKHLLNSVNLCPEFHYSYFELSVNYAKRGLIHEWLGLINKAVEIAPEQYLGWRGWYHWFFMRNYKKAISDIEQLDSLVNYDIGTTGDGLYHLNILKGLCYKGLGDYNKAIFLIEDWIKNDEYFQGTYDYLHLGVLYLEIGLPERALEKFNVQKEYYDISEVYYYSAIAYFKMGSTDLALLNIDIALKKYDDSKTMSNPYVQLPDEIYRINILDKRNAFSNN